MVEVIKQTCEVYFSSLSKLKTLFYHRHKTSNMSNNNIPPYPLTAENLHHNCIMSIQEHIRSAIQWRKLYKATETSDPVLPLAACSSVRFHLSRLKD